MAISRDELSERYASLADDELLGIERSDLTPMAQQCFDAELEKRNLRFGVEAETNEDEFGEFEAADPEHEPDWMPNAFAACAFSGTSSGAMDAAAARDALLAEGIPCEVTVHEIEPHGESASEIHREYRVMVPGALILQATSVLDVAIFNGQLESEWQTQLASLSDDELNTLSVESLCAGLLDRVERLRKAYKEEILRRRR